MENGELKNSDMINKFQFDKAKNYCTYIIIYCRTQLSILKPNIYEGLYSILSLTKQYLTTSLP